MVGEERVARWASVGGGRGLGVIAGLDGGGCALGKGSEWQVRVAGRGDRALDIQDPIGRVCTNI